MSTLLESPLDTQRWAIYPRAPMPRLVLLQSASPETRLSPTAQPGLLYVYPGGEILRTIRVIHLESECNFSVFRKRVLGGGFIDALPTAEDAQIALEAFPGDPADYDIVMTERHLCWQVDERGNRVQPVMIYMSGTKLAVSRHWLSQIQALDVGESEGRAVWRLSSVSCGHRNWRYYNYRVSLSALHMK